MLELSVLCLPEDKLKSPNFSLIFPLIIKFKKNGIKKVKHLSVCVLRAQIVKSGSDDPFLNPLRACFYSI